MGLSYGPSVAKMEATLNKWKTISTTKMKTTSKIMEDNHKKSGR
jgi:hypothetical protein